MDNWGTTDDLLGIRGALFDPDRKYRYALWRRWAWPQANRLDNLRSHLAVVGLNPSKANEMDNDNTVSRCVAFAKRWGRDGLVMLNLFPLIATDPKEMKATTMDRQRLALNTALVVRISIAVGHVVVAWGDDGEHLGAGEALLQKLIDAGVGLQALAVNKTGHPRHPLYVAAATEPKPYRPWWDA